MFEIILYACALGVMLSFSPGPLFFDLLNTSISKGFKRAFFLELGIVLSDVLYLFIAYFFAGKVVHWIEDHPNIKYLGGAVFILFGLYSIFKAF